MRGTRRLARLEASLSPQPATVLWLAEAQRFGSLAAYAASLLDQPASRLPLVAVPQQARQAVRGALRGQPRGVIAEREEEAVHEALFLVELVLELERAARATLRQAELRWLVLWAGRSALADGSQSETSQGWSRAARDLMVTIASAQAARSLLEGRYLDGRSAIFPDTLTAWQELQEAVRLLVRDVRPPTSAAAIKSRATAIASAIAQTADAGCLAMLGDSSGSGTGTGTTTRPS